MLSPDVASVLDGAVRSELARRRLLDFATAVYPTFESPRHIAYIAGLLERVDRGDLRRLAISVPVRQGKSVLGSQVFPAFYLGRHPSKNVVLASHAEELAVRSGRIAKNIVSDRERWPFSVELAQDSQASGRWNTREGGGLYAVGVGGSITGRGADLLVIDDALHDALSLLERERLWSWYREVAIPRLEPGGAVVIIGARLAEDDLTGRILASEDGPSWTVVNFPAIAEENDVLGRAVGEALWPERMNLQELEMRRSIMGALAFESQFQQRPLPREGAMFSRAWFEPRYTEIPKHSPIPNFVPDPVNSRFEPGTIHLKRTRTIQAIDTASKTGIANDYSVIVTIASDHVNNYIVDIRREKVEFPDLVRMVLEEFRRHDPEMVYVEDSSAGTAVVQELRRETALPIIPVRAVGSKIARAEAVTAVFEARRVLLPQHAPWLGAFIDEMCAFPASRHDDQVDAVVLGLTSLRDAIERFDWHDSLATRSRVWAVR